MTDERTADLAVMSVADLRQRRDAVRRQGEALSYRRRLLQAQMDIVAQLSMAGQDEDLATQIARAIADTPGGSVGEARAVVVSAHPEMDVAPLPTGLAGFDARKMASLLEALRIAEAEASVARRTLLDELDMLQTTLVARYRESGVNVASLLPGDGV